MPINDYALAERIQREVNFSTTYRTDAEQYGRPEHWVEAGKFGDCEDYALLKRAMLRNQGWPADKLALCTCWCEDGGYHCVLFVDTDLGGYILDNRREWPTKPMLTGCATTGDQVILGPEVYGPYGWRDYCARYPTDPDCHPSPQQ
jgi:predicted transglutaminase-like cysteine proteinase